MIAKDIMKKPVITAAQDMTLKELARLFSDRHISGAPVVDEEGRMVGVVSQTDLVRHDRETPESSEVPFYVEERPIERPGFLVETPDSARVRDVMTPVVLSADEKTPVKELARQMLRRHIHRLVVTRGGRLAGIVTSMDLLRAFVGKKL